MPEAGNRRGASGPTMGAIVRCSGVVAMDGRLLVPFRVMTVRVRLFAALRERAGADEVELELPPGARVGDALERLGDLAAGLPLVMAINREYADADAPLAPDDELALIPPVSGGATVAGSPHVRVSAEPL